MLWLGWSAPVGGLVDDSQAPIPAQSALTFLGEGQAWREATPCSKGKGSWTPRTYTFATRAGNLVLNNE